MIRLSIHPGGVRSGVFETMNDESLEMWIWDSYDAIPLPEVSVDDIIEWVKSKLTDDNHSSMSFGYVQNYIFYFAKVFHDTLYGGMLGNFAEGSAPAHTG